MIDHQPQNQSPMQGGPRGRAALAAAEALAGTIAQTVEVFLRGNFGERYFSIMGIYSKVVLYAVLLLIAFNASSQLETFPLGVYFFAAFLACLWHQFVIYRRSRQGKRWHSRYPGYSHLTAILPLDHAVIQRWVEPLLCVVAGSLLTPFNQALGAWIMFAGMCLGVTEALAEARFRTILLDAIDKDIESRNMRAVLIEQKDAKQTEGFVIPVGKMKPQQRESILNGLTSLYDRAKEAITHQGGRCAHCGAWNLADAGYCGNCGKSAAAVVTPTAAQPIQAPTWTPRG